MKLKFFFISYNFSNWTLFWKFASRWLLLWVHMFPFPKLIKKSVVLTCPYRKSYCLAIGSKVLPVFTGGWFRIWYSKKGVHFFPMTAQHCYSSDTPFWCMHDEVIFVGSPRRPGCRRHTNKGTSYRRHQQEQTSGKGYLRHFISGCYGRSTIIDATKGKKKAIRFKKYLF